MKTHRAKVPNKWRQRLVHLLVGRVKRRRLGLGDGVFRQPFLELGVLDELLRTLEVLFNALTLVSDLWIRKKRRIDDLPGQKTVDEKGIRLPFRSFGW
jgi:hypothetical protein